MSKRKARPRAHEPAHARPSVPEPPPASPVARWPVPRGSHVVAALIAIYVLVYGFTCFIKYRYYLYIDIDLAIFVQATDQALRGTLFSSIRGMYWLGDHVSLILLLLAPLHAIARHPLTLLMVQTVVLGLGAWPVYSLARRELKHDGVAAALAAVYLLYPAVAYTNLFEFHPEVLATTTLLATIACIAADRFVPTIVFAILSVMCKEDVALVVGMLGLAALLPGAPPRRWRYALSLAGVAVASLVLSFVVIRPAFGSSAAEYGKMYAAWGGGVGEVALNILRHPLRAISAFYDTPGRPFDITVKHLYWLEMLGPLLFLPLLSPLSMAVALPVLAEHFLSYRAQQHGLIYQYTALVTPVFVAAAVRGLGNLARLAARRPMSAEIPATPGTRRLLVVAAAATLLGSVYCNLLFGPLLKRGWMPVEPMSEAVWPDSRDRTLQPYRDRLVARVPKQGGVVTSFEFLSRLASRRSVESLHHIYMGVYTFSTEPYPTPTGIDAFLADMGDPRLAAYVRPSTSLRLRELMANNHLRPVETAGDVILLQRDPPDTVELVHVGAPPPPGFRPATFDGQLTLEGAVLPEPTVARGGLLTLQTHWRITGPVDRLFITQLFVLRDGQTPEFAINRHLGYLFYPVPEWPRDSTVRETYRLPIPLKTAPGSYTLGVRLAWWRGEKSGISALDPPDRPFVEVGRFTVTDAAR